ncbi:phytanoyl-CoA dioxygenase family protein, partial [Corallococcus sp. CA054B]|uniref:phytanoyl-CoA dioxygenase family protein n=1 Tax=Corallococcus sp. CA054B TaxID=2316734 RepID=UPI003519E70C
MPALIHDGRARVLLAARHGGPLPGDPGDPPLEGLGAPCRGPRDAQAPARGEAADAEAHVVPLPVRAGEALLVHNHVWHRSGRGRPGQRRRAF